MELLDRIENILKTNNYNNNDVIITDDITNEIESVSEFKSPKHKQAFMELLEKECIKTIVQADETYSFNKAIVYLNPTTKEIEWIVIDE